MTTLFERPTIEYLAELIRRALPKPVPEILSASMITSKMLAHRTTRFEFLVPIRREGKGAPVYCVHGAGGNVLNFWPIMHHMGLDRPVYGLQARGVDGLGQPHTDIHSMASAYLAEVRALQPVGPYYLTGYCGGGWIAFEMARQLRVAGESVAMLVLLDCYGPRVKMPAPTWAERWRCLKTEGLQYVVRKTGERVRRDWHTLSASLRIQWHRERHHAVPHELRDFWLTRSFEYATKDYKGDSYDGELVLLRARDMDPQLREVGANMGWAGMAQGGIQVIDVPGNHHTLALEPNAACLAAVMRQCLLDATRHNG